MPEALFLRFAEPLLRVVNRLEGFMLGRFLEPFSEEKA